MSTTIPPDPPIRLAFSLLDVVACKLSDMTIEGAFDLLVVVNWQTLHKLGFEFQVSTCELPNVYIFQIVHTHMPFMECMATKGGASRSVFDMVRRVDLVEAQQFCNSRIAAIAAISESDFE